MDSMVTQFSSLPTTCISDSMNGLNNLHPTIKPLKEEFKLAGRAFTVQIPVGDNLAVLKAIREAKPGDIIVVDAKGDSYRAIAGDFVAGMMKTLEIGGLVVDGVIRDIVGIKQLNYPVFCKGTTVAASGKAGVGEINIPISCGGMTVHPGDLIVGDADGVVVVPQAIEHEVLMKAKEILKRDEDREANISGNPEAVRKHLDQLFSK
ncbi:RraA family protein [Neobacillus sp. Marseille-QA0830]